MKKTKPRHSFRFVLSISTLICWLMPVIIISTTAGMLLNRNYNRNLRRSTKADIQSAIRQVEIRLNSVLEDAKSISYDGTVYQVYLNEQDDPVQTDLNQSVTDYLWQKFSRNIYLRTVWVAFPDSFPDELPFCAAPMLFREDLPDYFREQVLPAAAELAQGAGIYFTVIDGQLYLARNLTDGEGNPFALLVMELEKTVLMQSFYGLSQNQSLDVTIDGVSIPLDISAEITMDPSRTADLSCSAEVDGHILVCNGQVIGLNIWTTVPMLRWIVVFVGSLVIPMMLVMFLMFYWNINRPISILIDANRRMESGERGYQIDRRAPNREFAQLYHHFNSMSSELECQFRQLYEEQLALQQAKIKALQSQINPHFLNNTLEVINWEARLAENDRVCTMIEALSTMLDAAIGRDGRSQVLLSEEMKYVEAYLYITKERLGDRLRVTEDIAPETLCCTVPLLMLQPILENAVEYDLSRTGGELSIRTFLLDQELHLEVSHDGNISAEGWDRIRSGLTLSDPGASHGRSVGIQNVVSRLALLYGGSARLNIRECCPGKILAEIILPTAPPNQTKNTQ